MTELYLISRMAGEIVAFPAASIDSVVRVSETVPIPSAPPFVIGLFALRSRVLTLIDAAFHVTGDVTQVQADSLAIVVNIAGNAYGLMVDQVLDVIPAEGGELPLRGKLSRNWAAISRAMLMVDGKSVLVVMPEALTGYRESAIAA